MAVLTYKCPNCDGGLVFDPKSQEFNCEYCGSHFTEEQMEDIHHGHDHHDQAQSDPQKEENQYQTMLYTCPSCGAEIATDETTAATLCYYCHNPVVLSGKLEGEYKPDKLIPFVIDRETAVKEFLAWTAKKKFVPKDFFSKQQIEKITGVYFPYWLVDSDLNAKMNAQATRVRIWRQGNMEYTETDHFRVMRKGEIHFEDISKNALQKENSRLCDSVHPYDSSNLEEYNPAFLSGFQAEKRNVEREAYEEEVHREIEDYAGSLLKQTITGYSTVLPQDVSVSDCRLHWDYTLLPVWTLTYRGHDKKIYYYTMNGQTGKVTGVLPLDTKKLYLTFGIIAVLLIPVLLLILMGGKML